MRTCTFPCTHHHSWPPTWTTGTKRLDRVMVASTNRVTRRSQPQNCAVERISDEQYAAVRDSCPVGCTLPNAPTLPGHIHPSNGSWDPSNKSTPALPFCVVSSLPLVLHTYLAFPVEKGKGELPATFFISFLSYLEGLHPPLSSTLNTLPSHPAPAASLPSTVAVVSVTNWSAPLSPFLVLSLTANSNRFRTGQEHPKH